MRNTRALWWSVAIALVLVAVTVILPRLARARVGSGVTADVKLAPCTNSPLKIPIKQMPKRQTIDLVFGVPEELTNAMEQISGSLSTAGGLSVVGAASTGFTITANSRATWPSVIMGGEEPLVAYFLSSVEGAPARFRRAEIHVTFSNTPPAGVSLWARYRFNRYHPVHVK